LKFQLGVCLTIHIVQVEPLFNLTLDLNSKTIACYFNYCFWEL